jgi:hypothetical protein
MNTNVAWSNIYFQAYLVDRALNTYVKPKSHVIIVFLKKVSLPSMDIDLNFILTPRA